MAALRVYLFGGLRVYGDDKPLPPFPTQKTRSLFAYLVTFREREHRRDLLAGTLWGNAPIAQARRNLNTTLWRLQRTLPPGLIVARGDRLAFVPTADCWLDIAAFETLLGEAGLDPGGSPTTAPLPDLALDALLQAVELYRGDLLEGLEEPWSMVEAERLRTRYLQALQRLVTHYRTSNAPETALNYARRLLEVDPLREEAHRQAMELYLALGRPGEALAQYERCRRTLQEELATTPLAETTALYERIRTGSDPLQIALPVPEPYRPHPLPRTPFDDLGRMPLVGREREWSIVKERIEAAGRGRGGLLLIQGRAGIGKSRLLQEAVRYAEERGWLVLRGACRELRHPPPYQGWSEALRPAQHGLDHQHLARIAPHTLAELSALVPEIRRLFPNLPPPEHTSPLEQENRLLQAIGTVLQDLARACPCLVALEDLHWADTAGLETLEHVVRQAGYAPLLCIGTARPTAAVSPLHDTLLHLQDHPAFHQMVLSPLGWSETAQLVSEVLGWNSPDPLFTARLYQETRGNPFFVTEALKGLFEHGLLAWNALRQWDASRLTQAGSDLEWPLRHGVHHVVQQRLEHLSCRGRQLLELTAVLGGTVEPALLCRASGWRARPFQETADDLLRRQLLVEGEDGLSLVHDTLQQVLYRGLSADRRRALHERAGETLEEMAPRRIEELAHHFSLAQQMHRALPYCLQAGQRAKLLYALQPALAYYTWAVEMAGRVGGREGRRAALEAHEERGKILTLLGDSDRAMADFAAMEAAARALGDEAAVARAVRRTAWAHGDMQGEWDEALRGTRRAYDLARAADSKREMAIALLDVGACLSARGEPAPALEALREALALANETSDRGARAASLQYMVLPCDLLGDYAMGCMAAREAVAIWCTIDNRRHAAASTLIDEGFLHLHWGNLGEAERALGEAHGHLREIGIAKGFRQRLIGLAAVHGCRGQVAFALTLLEQAAAVGADAGPNPYVEAMLCVERGRLGWAAGRPAAALRDFRSAVELARGGGTASVTVEALNELGSTWRRLGLAGPALALHHEALDIAAPAGLARGQAAGLMGAGLAALALGRTAEGLAQLQQAVRRARRLGPRSLGEALVALSTGCLEVWKLAPALALARRAGGLAAQVGHQWLLMESLLLEGRALGGLGRMEETERALRRAWELPDPAATPSARWEIALALAYLLAEAGRPAEAGTFLREARTGAEAILSELDDPALRAAFCARLEVCALLGETGGALASDQERFLLARLGAPTGRPLRPEEQVGVRWTLPPPIKGQDKAAVRRAHLLRLVNEARAQGADPSEEDLAHALAVTVRTVRNDIAALRRAGRPIRTRGTRPR